MGQAARINQLVQKYLTSRRVQAQQTGRSGHSEAEPRQIEVFAKEPAFHMFQSQQFHTPLDATSRRKAHANAVSQSALFQWRASRQMSVKMIETCSPAFECPAVLNCPLRQATRHKSAAQNWGTVDTTAFRFESSRFHSELPARLLCRAQHPQCSFRAPNFWRAECSSLKQVTNGHRYVSRR